MFRSDFTTFRRTGLPWWWGFICVKNIIACTELWVEDDFETVAVEGKGMDPKYTWEIMCICIAVSEDVLVIGILAASNLTT